MEILTTPKGKGGLFLASSLCDGLEDTNIKQVTTLLLNKEANPNILIPTYGITPFHLVIGNDSEIFALDVTKLFLRHGGDPNVRSVDGLTPVHVAAAWGRVNVLELLLANGGNPLQLDDEDRSPFHYAFDGRYYKAITVLGKYCSDNIEEDEKPKYNIELNKILINTGEILAEYIPQNILSNTCDTSVKKLLYDYNNVEKINPHKETNYMSELCNNDNTNNVFSSNINFSYVPSNIINSTQSKILKGNEDNNNVQTDSTSNMNLNRCYINESIEREKFLVNEIIGHLSSTLSSDSTINETLFGQAKNFKRQMPKKSSPKNLIKPLSVLHIQEHSERNSTNIKQKYSTTTKIRKNGKLKNNVIKSTITPNKVPPIKENLNYERKIASARKNTTNYLDNSIISTSPNFYTPTNERRKQNLAKISYGKKHSSPKSLKSDKEFVFTPKMHKYDNTSHLSDLKMRSTPRKKHKQACKTSIFTKQLYSNRKMNENIIQKTQKRDKCDKLYKNTISSSDSSMSSLSPKYTYSSHWTNKKHANDCLAIKLDEGRYDEDFEGISYSNSLSTDSDTTNSSNISTDIKSEDSSSHNKLEDKFSFNSANNNNYVKKECAYPLITKKEQILDKVGENIGSKKIITLSEIEPIQISDNKLNCISQIDGLKNKIQHDENTVLIRNKNNSPLMPLEENIFNISKKYNNESQSLHEDVEVDNKNSLHLLKTKCYNKKFTDSLIRLDIQNKSFFNASNNCFDSEYYEKDQSVSRDLEIKDLQKLSTKNIGTFMTEKSLSSLRSSSTYVTVHEDYKYEDPEEGIILFERRICTASSSFSGESKLFESNLESSNKTNTSKFSSNFPSELLLIDDYTLRKRLTELGHAPGPITKTTKSVYLKRLINIEKATYKNSLFKKHILKTSEINSNITEIKPWLKFGDWVNDLNIYKTLEKNTFKEFSLPDPSRKWREGTAKTSFNYLLLDPRITQNLSYCSTHLTESEIWTNFLSAIFYIGKGKRSRPYSHLYDAFKAWVSKEQNPSNKKVKYILDIWNKGYGVVCLHVFQNTIPVEAYTREAAMIEALGTEALENCKGGDYYGITATWNVKDKRIFGRFLLYRALQIFIHEGERQLFPEYL